MSSNFIFFFECTVENKHEREVKTPGEVIKEERRASSSATLRRSVDFDSPHIPNPPASGGPLIKSGRGRRWVPPRHMLMWDGVGRLRRLEGEEGEEDEASI